MGDGRVLRVLVGTEGRAPVVIHVGAHVHQARNQEGNAHEGVPDRSEVREGPAPQVRELVDEQGRPQHGEDRAHGGEQVERRSEGDQRREHEQGPADAGRGQHVGPIDPGARTEGLGEPLAQLAGGAGHLARLAAFPSSLGRVLLRPACGRRRRHGNVTHPLLVPLSWRCESGPRPPLGWIGVLRPQTIPQPIPARPVAGRPGWGFLTPISGQFQRILRILYRRSGTETVFSADRGP